MAYKSLLKLPAGLWEIAPRPYFHEGMNAPAENLPWGTRYNVKETEDGHEIFEACGFELGSVLGRGSFSLVVMAYWAQYRQNVAVKIYSKKKDLDIKIDLQMLPIEIETLKTLKHPNIVSFYGAWETKGKVYLVLELLGNGNLLEYLRKHDRVDEAQAKIWFAQLVSGVKYIHDMEIAHRDLKLSNLLLDMKQNIRITDFGFSTPNISWEEEIPNSGWPKVTDYRGSLCYMSPEMVRREPYNPILADVWALGIVLYSIIFGKLPLGEFTPETLTEMVKQFIIPDSPEISYECKKVFRSIFKFEADRIRSINLLESDWLLDQIEDIMIGKQAKLKLIDVFKDKEKEKDERKSLSDKAGKIQIKKERQKSALIQLRKSQSKKSRIIIPVKSEEFITASEMSINNMSIGISSKVEVREFNDQNETEFTENEDEDEEGEEQQQEQEPNLKEQDQELEEEDTVDVKEAVTEENIEVLYVHNPTRSTSAIKGLPGGEGAFPTRSTSAIKGIHGGEGSNPARSTSAIKGIPGGEGANPSGSKSEIKGVPGGDGADGVEDKLD